MHSPQGLAIVTGASSGTGAAYADRPAACRQDRLQALAQAPTRSGMPAQRYRARP
ncbi:MAG: hypothetical protein LBI66_03750 [Burkholderiaceae bacterium]|jgi:NADP-dependent 3-hydroxy acid dehydrogenase YdfG|nr:hypothetical protein [Burkholderiaceae bacterium]